MRNDLPLSIIDDEIPQDVYHHTLNPNPSTDQESPRRKKKKNSQNKTQE
jgi:hypothetical protein